MRRTPQSDIELMPQIQVLDFSRRRDLSQLEMSETSKRSRANIARENAPIPPYIAKPRADGIFGNDRA